MVTLFRFGPTTKVLFKVLIGETIAYAVLLYQMTNSFTRNATTTFAIGTVMAIGSVTALSLLLFVLRDLFDYSLGKSTLTVVVLTNQRVICVDSQGVSTAGSRDEITTITNTADGTHLRMKQGQQLKIEPIRNLDLMAITDAQIEDAARNNKNNGTTGSAPAP